MAIEPSHPHDASEATSADFDAASRPSTQFQSERTTLARKENATVAWLKALVFGVLLVTATAVSLKVYIYTSTDQARDFREHFAADAERVIDSFHSSVARTLEAVDALSVTITSHAKATGASFPNVTLPDFAVRSANIRVLSGSVLVHYQPLVTDDQRAGWEEYAKANRNHVAEDYEVETDLLASQDAQFKKVNDRQLQEFDKFDDRIKNLLPHNGSDVAPLSSGPFLPLWQVSPVTPTKFHINFNALSHPASAGAYRETLATGQAVIDAAANLNGENLDKTAVFFALILSLSQFRYSVSEYLGEPVSGVGYPIFDSFDLKKRKVVGLLSTSLYWRLYFEGVLPKNTKGIFCVVENTLGQNFTYRIDDKVSYVGNGDLHDPKYNHLVRSTDVIDFIEESASPVTKALTSVSLNGKYCRYKLHVFPSQDNENLHITGYPVTLTLGIACVFAFTSLIFVLYTMAVNRRQQVVMDRAVASSAIVSSLFPEQVRDQIYKENEVPAEDKKAWKTSFGRNSLDSVGPSSASGPSARPIANLFENTTIMFADMVGFTAWSSKRDPVQVFELLETIYHAFDVLAARRNVFKVETIGDCYVAVAGLPDPQEDHAVIMAKFSNDCVAKMCLLMSEMAGSLGADTAELTLRVGLHSGSVTGGVLRGQKSRFQLFGDTMNTASRMESNGAPGRIHVSRETANELVAHGKAAWVTKRDDMILAKGKGELQTYWVSPRSVVTSASDPSEAHCTNGTEAINDHGEPK